MGRYLFFCLSLMASGFYGQTSNLALKGKEAVDE